MTKDELIAEHRHWNTDHIDWWDSVDDCFKEQMKAKGIEVDKIYFSGFWSQGDGACFEGSVVDWDLFLKSLGYDNPTLIQHAMHHWVFRVSHFGHYYHENCTSFSWELPMLDGCNTEEFVDVFSPYPPDDLRTHVWLSVLSQFIKPDFGREFTEDFKEHMRSLYSDLEDEYDYLTSDEAVWESLEANDMTAEVLCTQP